MYIATFYWERRLRVHHSFFSLILNTVLIRQKYCKYLVTTWYHSLLQQKISLFHILGLVNLRKYLFPGTLVPRVSRSFFNLHHQCFNRWPNKTRSLGTRMNSWKTFACRLMRTLSDEPPTSRFLCCMLPHSTSIKIFLIIKCAVVNFVWTVWLWSLKSCVPFPMNFTS